MDSPLRDLISKLRAEIETIQAQIRRLEEPGYQAESTPVRSRIAILQAPISKTRPERSQRQAHSPFGHREEVASKRGGATKTVLMLKGELSLIKLMRVMLDQCRLIEANTATEALLLFIDADQRIDLLIANVTLPMNSGIYVALLLRSKIPTLPVILISRNPVSAWTDQQSVDLKRLGSQSVVIFQEPFSDNSFADAVCELLGTGGFEKATTAQPSP